MVGKADVWSFWLFLGILVVAYLIDYNHDLRWRDSFSWMDPEQYYDFAADWMNGLGFDQIIVPSIFPIFIVPFLSVGGVSVPSALWVNALFLIVLCLAVHRLCRQLDINVPSPVVSAVILSSPLLIGLSRELYIEFALTGFSALAFALWFDYQGRPTRRRMVLFGLVYGLGFMLKMTFPVFFIGPFIVLAVSLVKNRHYSLLGKDFALFCVPVIIAVVVMCLVFKQSSVYYLDFGNTTVPIMKFIGPLGVLSTPSLFYYVSNIWKTMLFLLTPFLVLALLWSRPWAAVTNWKTVVLWAWLIGPLILLTLVEVKEPRHVAPCVVPAVLLLFKGISTIRSTCARYAMTIAVVTVSVTQYVLVKEHAVAAPYYLDRASGAKAITETMVKADPRLEPHQASSILTNELYQYCWMRTKNIVLQGFDPNMALLLAWHFRPSAVYDLDQLKEERRGSKDFAYDRFENLYFFTAFNLYNRRCLKRNYYHTLDADTVLTNADYILISERRGDAGSSQASGFHSAGTIRTSGTAVQVLVANTPSVRSYRSIYAREFLSSGKTFPPEDYTAIYFDLTMDAFLRQDFPEVNKLLKEYPLERGLDSDMRKIYWIKEDTQLKDIVVDSLHSYVAQQGKQREPPK